MPPQSCSVKIFDFETQISRWADKLDNHFGIKGVVNIIATHISNCQPMIVIIGGKVQVSSARWFHNLKSG